MQHNGSTVGFFIVNTGAEDYYRHAQPNDLFVAKVAGALVEFVLRIGDRIRGR